MCLWARLLCDRGLLFAGYDGRGGGLRCRGYLRVGYTERSGRGRFTVRSSRRPSPPRGGGEARARSSTPQLPARAVLFERWWTGRALIARCPPEGLNLVRRTEGLSAGAGGEDH